MQSQSACPGCQALEKRVAELEALVRQLLAENEALRRRGKRQAAPFAKGKTKSHPKKPGRKPGKDYGAQTQRQPPEKLDEIIDVPLPNVCSCGCDAIVETGVVQQFQTEIPRKPIHRRFDIRIGQCGNCGKRLQGRHESQTSDATGAAASQIGPDAQAAMVLLNKDMGLSHGKIQSVLESLFGITIGRSTSVRTMLRSANRCQPVYAQIRDELASGDVLWPDETGWRVGGASHWLHGWVGRSATCYHIDAGRSADALEELIGIDWSGLMHSDGYATYNRFSKALRQQCTAHILHRARDMLERAVGGAVHFPRQVIDLFTRAIGVRKQYQRGEISLDDMTEQRDALELRLSQLVLPDRDNEANARLSKHLNNHFIEWFTFLSTSTAETTNNRAERALRPAVVNRKVWGGNRTSVGAVAQSVLMSVLQTCRQNSLAVVDRLSQLLRGQTTALFRIANA